MEFLVDMVTKVLHGTADDEVADMRERGVGPAKSVASGTLSAPAAAPRAG